ncbi:MAG: hypothetical protein ABI882_15480 [Acidobacteriota bacterium]
MKRSIAPTVLVFSFATVFVLAILPRAEAQTEQQVSGSIAQPNECSNRSLRGSFGFTSVGNLLEAGGFPPAVVGPFAEVGRQTFNGRGKTQGTATLSANGNILKVTFAGTYEVKPDCTGSMTFLVDPLGPPAVTADFVIDDDGAELRVILTGTGAVESRIYKKQFSPQWKEY